MGWVKACTHRYEIPTHRSSIAIGSVKSDGAVSAIVLHWTRYLRVGVHTAVTLSINLHATVEAPRVSDSVQVNVDCLACGTYHTNRVAVVCPTTISMHDQR